jgi:hypothetical protein
MKLGLGFGKRHYYSFSRSVAIIGKVTDFRSRISNKTA